MFHELWTPHARPSPHGHSPNPPSLPSLPSLAGEVDSTAPASYFNDERVSATLDPAWPVSQTGWGVCPEGLRELLMLLRRRYGPIPTLITENGIALQEVRLPHIPTSTRPHVYSEEADLTSRKGEPHVVSKPPDSPRRWTGR